MNPELCPGIREKVTRLDAPPNFDSSERVHLGECVRCTRLMDARLLADATVRALSGHQAPPEEKDADPVFKLSNRLLRLARLAWERKRHTDRLVHTEFLLTFDALLEVLPGLASLPLVHFPAGFFLRAQEIA